MRRPIPGKRDRLRQLRAFCTAARLRSLSAAAEHLGLTQPAVSLQVRELEHELGAVLLERARAGVTLTPAGERLYAHAAPLVGAVDAVFDDLHASIDDADAAPQVRLGASGMCAAFLLPPYLARFRERHRAVALRLETVPVDEGLALLRDEAVDFVVASAVPDAGEAVDYHALLASRLVLIVPLGHPLAARERVSVPEAGAWPAVVPPAGSAGRAFGEALARRFGVDVDAVVEVGGWGVLKRYVEAGFGVSVVPRLCVSPGDPLSVVELDAELPAVGYGVYIRRDRALIAPAARLLQLMIPELSLPSPPPRSGARAAGGAEPAGG